MLRHTALFLHRDTTTPDQHLAMLKGLAYMRFECRGVRALDYGADIFGGSSRRWELKPWLRTPTWHAQQEGPVSNHDVALHLDFDDETGFDAYNEDETHAEVGAYNASVNLGEFTARINYWYDGPPSIAAGHVRLCSLFLWAPGAGDADEERATAAMQGLETAAGVDRVTKPNPRGRPVARSFGRLTFTTVPPVASKSCLRTSSEMLSGSPATNSFASSFAMR